MDISTRYNIGDTVWVLSEEYDEFPCPACVNGKIIGKDGQPYHCLQCDGTGKAICDTPVIRPCTITVNHIMAELFDDEMYVRYGTGKPFSPKHSEASCYATEAEAQAAADRLNKDGIR